MNGSCEKCARNEPRKTIAPLQPIVVTELWEYVQAGLIDMRGNPDGEFKWILHIRDHFSKFSAGFALKTKASNEVVDGVMCSISLFGPPRDASYNVIMVKSSKALGLF